MEITQAFTFPLILLIIHLTFSDAALIKLESSKYNIETLEEASYDLRTQILDRWRFDAPIYRASLEQESEEKYAVRMGIDLAQYLPMKSEFAASKLLQSRGVAGVEYILRFGKVGEKYCASVAELSEGYMVLKRTTDYEDYEFKTAEERTKDLKLALGVMVHALPILEKIHAAKIVHRNLKPVNFLVKKGETEKIDGLIIAGFNQAYFEDGFVNEIPNGNNFKTDYTMIHYIATNSDTSTAYATDDLQGLIIFFYNFVCGRHTFPRLKVKYLLRVIMAYLEDEFENDPVLPVLQNMFLAVTDDTRKLPYSFSYGNTAAEFQAVLDNLQA